MILFGENIRVEYYNDPDDDKMGQYHDLPVPTIRINTAYSLRTQAKSLVHEYFHALYATTDDPDDGEISEERAARLFELGVTQLAKFNFKVLEALKGDYPNGDHREEIG